MSSSSAQALGARFSTRRRLFVAFSALAALFAIAFWSQVVGLRRIEGRLGELQEHDEQARLTLEIENAIRAQFVHEAQFIAGEDAQLDGYREARARAVRLLAELDHRVTEPELHAWLAEIRDITEELDRRFQARIAPPAALNGERGALARVETAPLAHRVDVNVDRVFAFLRTETASYHVQVHELEQTTFALAILFLIGTPVLAFAIAIYLSRSITRPLAVLGEGAARVAGGDLSTRIDTGTGDEFGALASKFNAMTAALKAQQEKLVVSEKLASLGRLAAGVAHELNNPLQVMLGYISLDKPRVRGELEKHFAALEREALRCKEIVEELLQLSRPAIPIVAEPIDLREVAEEVGNALRMALGEPQPAIRVEGAGTALGTRGRFRQILFNLAKNGAEAAGGAGRVDIVVSAAQSTVEVAVSDSGAGVAPTDLTRMFEPFFTTKSTGTGLGLPMARAVASALGGEIVVGCSEMGGARFTLRVPRAPDGGA